MQEPYRAAGAARSHRRTLSICNPIKYLGQARSVKGPFPGLATFVTLAGFRLS